MIEQIKQLNHRLMYGHTMAIYRLTKTKQDDCSTTNQWVMISQGIPCKLSNNEPDKGNRIKEDVNPIMENFTVFCAPEVEVKAGDLLEINGIKYRAGDPFRYPTHQQIRVARSDLA